MAQEAAIWLPVRPDRSWPLTCAMAARSEWMLSTQSKASVRSTSMLCTRLVSFAAIQAPSCNFTVMIYDSVVTIQQHDQLPQFSLLMSVYANDSLPQVERAIASATVEQSLPPTQIVIIRDGRVPDDIARFLQGLPETVADWFSRSGVSSRPRPEVTVVPLEVNQGLAHALNEGLRRCRYDVVARADSDDISLPERFATMMPLFAADRAPAIDIAGSAIQEFTGEENRNGQVRTLPREGAELERFARMQSPLHHPSVVFRKSVVLAAGGFAAGELAARYRPHTREHYSMSPAGNDGAAFRLASALNACEGADLPSNFFWAPVSVLRHADGREERFPHLVTDRAKPGVIAVNQKAERFVNESNSYHHFASAMQSQPENAPCFLICDALAMKRYGLGLARPAPVNNDALIEAGYLHKADSLARLAQQLGLDAQALAGTVARYNRDAAQGEDPQFAKGGNSYNRAMGDPGHQPNACNAPLLKAPFYAITLYTGDLGTSRGLVTSENAQVLNQQRQPIQGLYAVGNDMDSMMAGTYPGPGITLGPALTFGYLCARHMTHQLTPSTGETS